MSLLMLLLAGGNAEAKKYKPAPRTAKNIVIAHRGYWNTPGAFENSIKAIDNAMNFGIYGSEFDINFTADDSIVVVHGSKHPVVKDLVIQESTFDKVRNTLLGNGEKGEKGGCMVHNPGYDFNDDIITTGATLFARLVEKHCR